jgi:ABC-2 type transport system ATP-binding protein
LPDSNRLSGDLSVGMRQRLNLAIAELGSPQVLLLDEPTASLDQEQRRRLWEAIDTQTGAGGSVVFATQNVEEVERATRVARLRDGELVA